MEFDSWKGTSFGDSIFPEQDVAYISYRIPSQLNLELVPEVSSWYSKYAESDSWNRHYLGEILMEYKISDNRKSLIEEKIVNVPLVMDLGYRENGSAPFFHCKGDKLNSI